MRLSKDEQKLDADELKVKKKSLFIFSQNNEFRKIC